MAVPERVTNGDKLRVSIRVSNPTSSPIVRRLVLRFNGNELPLEVGVQPGQELAHEATLDVPTYAVGTFAVVLADAESGETIASGNVTLGTAAPSNEHPSSEVVTSSTPSPSAYLLALAVIPPAAAAVIVLNRRRTSRVPRSPERIPQTAQLPKTRPSGTRPSEFSERAKIHRRYREHSD